ncbi:uncharacterized protein [Procambarus clarkii]|uniref:uncharacterized protein n=1 Tax=Procambarus clarkii TaxID=6728 RepID=UPI001E675098|nr:uncharacterized protein LOC123763125 [Procambarus clarkii]
MSNPRGIEPARPRFVYLTTDGAGASIWRLPLATTQNDLPLGEGALYYGSLGAATAATLFTIAHAILFAGRRKRDLSSVVSGARDDPDLESDMERIFAKDNDWCSLRLTCELAAKAGNPLDDKEKLLLSYFKGVVSTEDLQVMTTPELYYAYASFVGFSRGSQDECRQLYSKCPYSARKMMSVFKTAHSRLKRRPRGLLQPSY